MLFALDICQHILLNGFVIHRLILPGNLAAWKKKEGDEIAAGDSIAEIETDKVMFCSQHCSDRCGAFAIQK